MDDSEDTRQLRLGHRHLAFFFIGAVAVCAIFFALGFVVGRGQTYEAAMKEQSSTAKTSDIKSSASFKQASLEDPIENAKLTAADSARPDPKRDQEADYRRELDFYNSLDRKNADENFHPASQKAERKPASPEGAKSKTAAPVRTAPSGNLASLQVGAFSNSRDADKLAKTLRSKGYSVSLVSPGSGSSDKLFRIHVGPFTRLEEASRVRTQLQKDGYEAILKR
jgi:cell division protein FtsN